MAKGLLGGMTDYNHQSFDDVVNDLALEKERTISFKNAIQTNIEKLTANGYWTNKVPFNFRSNVEYAVRHYNTSIDEFSDLLRDMKVEVKAHHVTRLYKIASVAREINVDMGRTWHQEYDNKDYGKPNFRIVENIYADTRDMAVNLLDVSNMAERLKDFIGKTNPNVVKNNPWISGSFYLTLIVVIIAGLAVISQLVNWKILPIIIIGGLLLIVVVGLFQLRNDGRITDKSFVSLLKEVFKLLPLVGQRK
jgi:hypothetical protein